jgi:signal transduction histidine kinase
VADLDVRRDEAAPPEQPSASVTESTSSTRLGLRRRVAISFGVLSLAVAVAVAGTAYAFARSYLLSQRESTAVTRALLDARAVTADLADGTEPGEALARVPSVGESQALARVDGTWYSRGVTLSPDDLPPSLLEEAERSGAAQMAFRAQGTPYFAVAVTTTEGLYLELFPLTDLDNAFTAAGWFLIVVSLLALGAGFLVGRAAAARLMRPVESLGAGATAIASGDLSVRLPASGDPDLDPLSDAFNDMADAVEQRIARERRFVANVSHELRSPVTTILGTAELLERHSDAMPARDAALVSSLAARSRSLSRTLVDLLELGSDTSGAPVLLEATDLAALVENLLDQRDLVGLLYGDRPVIRTDARRIERVLANAVDNAETHGRGLTRVTIVRTPEDVVVHVDDAGPGIDPGSIERVFEPFVRVQRPGEPQNRDGAGLGLAIAKESAEAVGATVQIVDSPTGGARFTLRIPAVTS